MKTFLLFFCFLLGLLQSAETCAQKENENIHHIINKVTERTDSFATEKIYVQTDKPYYAAKDTMWFSMYLFNASRLSASSKSSIAYIEIADEENKVKRRMMVSLYFGLGWGNFVFKEREFPQGNYTVRAYTNWMRNFDENYIFTKQFYISSPGENDLLINTSLDAKPEAGETRAAMNLQVRKINQKPLSNYDFQLKITDGNRIWFRDKAKTSSNGSLDFNFTIPGKVNADKLFVSLQSANNTDENPVYKVPVIFNRRENIDLQFMPEGGYLVAGVSTHVAFKALGEDGNGASVSISVYNSKGEEVLASQSAHLGMGSFNLQPKPGENYVAKIKFADGTQSKEYALPAVKPSGTVLNVINKIDSDSLEINITASADVLAAGAYYYLMGESRGLSCYGAGLSLDGSSKMIRVSKTVFATGISHFTLLNEDRQPLNERLVYINQDDHLRVNVTADKMEYSKRDSVGITIAVTDKNGLPVQGSFSVSVTEDAQVKIDSLKRKSIKSVLLLSSDLKGHIEDPGYYFPLVMTNDIWQHLDNLLLTQGWVNYDWATLFQPLKALTFPAETNFSIKGKVTNVFNKPVENSKVLLLSRTPAFVKDTTTNAAGVFDFPNIFPSDTAAYFIQSRNKKGKSFNVGIVMDEFQPPVFSAPAERIIPWYVNIDSNKVKALHTLAAYKEDWEKKFGFKVLQEVKVAGRKIIKDSKNLNENGGSDISLNQEDIQKAGKATLGDLLRKNIPGFHLGGEDNYTYYINNRQFHLIIDGISTEWDFEDPGYDYYGQPRLKDFLDNYYAEDIKGIEVMKTSKYSFAYSQKYLKAYNNDPFEHAYVEVTTYSGSGPFLKNNAGVAVYRPMGFVPMVHFYSPKYNFKPDSSFIDSRSTIYWDPNIITDKNGNAAFSFYTADYPGTYTLIIEGCDMNGHIESKMQKIIVK